MFEGKWIWCNQICWTLSRNVSSVLGCRLGNLVSDFLYIFYLFGFGCHSNSIWSLYQLWRFVEMTQPAHQCTNASTYRRIHTITNRWIFHKTQVNRPPSTVLTPFDNSQSYWIYSVFLFGWKYCRWSLGRLAIQNASNLFRADARKDRCAVSECPFGVLFIDMFVCSYVHLFACHCVVCWRAQPWRLSVDALSISVGVNWVEDITTVIRCSVDVASMCWSFHHPYVKELTSVDDWEYDAINGVVRILLTACWCSAKSLRNCNVLGEFNFSRYLFNLDNFAINRGFIR